MKKIDQAKIRATAKKHKINTLYLFGSQARGDAGKLSDFDFAVIS
jgi:predicted nucleotidyltransferase